MINVDDLIAYHTYHYNTNEFNISKVKVLPSK